MKIEPRKLLLIAVAAVVAAGAGGYLWTHLHRSGPGSGFASGNGRIEATEFDIASKLGGRVRDIQVEEGDVVAAGQVLAHMQVQTLEAQRDEACARQAQAIVGIGSAEAQVNVRENERDAAIALVVQRESEVDAARRRLKRSETLVQEGAASAQEVDDDRARVLGAQAALAATRAQVQASKAGLLAARAQVSAARSMVTAAEATVARIDADIDDSALVAPRGGRIQYRIAETGEVVGPGGKVLSLVDLSDVYMTFFLPEAMAGRLAPGAEVHVVLDAVPEYVLPARVSFVASAAQFTPKTVETASERQKLMFRVKARIDRDLLRKHLAHVKTGLPGVAWVKLDPAAEWPDGLALKVP
ncbi:HlyD family secretion protein [Variovorax paradoxus]|uniref:HlyD family secretion protein n=1 Tax=Variovorax paradoxus TaxID=34073 RepID=UPI000783A493|nr:HlyD family efflux transporter periplasmic adaptor subunit [Variovorax paradoxus]